MAVFCLFRFRFYLLHVFQDKPFVFNGITCKFSGFRKKVSAFRRERSIAMFSGFRLTLENSVLFSIPFSVTVFSISDRDSLPCVDYGGSVSPGYFAVLGSIFVLADGQQVVK